MPLLSLYAESPLRFPRLASQASAFLKGCLICEQAHPIDVIRFLTPERNGSSSYGRAFFMDHQVSCAGRYLRTCTTDLRPRHDPLETLQDKKFQNTLGVGSADFVKGFV